MSVCDVETMKMLLQDNIKYSFKMLCVFLVLALILLALVLYCVISIMRALMFYVKRKQETKKIKRKIAEKSSNTNSIMSSDHDNEEYTNSPDNDPKQHAEAQDDFYKFQDSINKSLNEYKTYNQTLQNLFKTTRDKDAPDQYDKRIFDKENDNW